MEGTGKGKIILFGEHFVVHGTHAIAAGISNNVIVKIGKSDKLIFENLTNQKTTDATYGAINNILKSMNIKDKYKVIMDGDLPTYGGLGSSGAFCVGLARALSNEYKMNLPDEKINSHAFECEKAFHGNPSGVDNTMATYGGIMLFQRGKTPKENKFSKIKLTSPLNFVVCFSGTYSPTSKMVSKVKEFKDKNPEKFQELLNQMEKIIQDAQTAISNSNLEELGLLMNKNQELLEQIGVCSEENLKIIKLMDGALGAKLTGGGGGGCCIALAKNKSHAEEIKNKLENYSTFITEIF